MDIWSELSLVIQDDFFKIVPHPNLILISQYLKNFKGLTL